MGKTSIEWTGRSWPVSRGCSYESTGCERCYAESIAERFSGTDKNGKLLPFHGYAVQGKGWTRRVAFLPENLKEPLGWRDPQLVFVNSMSDLFHEQLSNEQIAAVFGVMAQSPRHTFQVLTKRTFRAVRFFDWLRDQGARHGPSPDEIVTIMAANHGADVDRVARPWPLPNVWVGASVENQKLADERIPALLSIPAAVRFLSCEPLLGAVQLGDALHEQGYESGGPQGWVQDREHGIDWVIVGGESGRRARPFDLEWARAIVRECKAAGVPVFVKQLGASPQHDGQLVTLRKKKGNDMAEWSEDLRVREMPRVSA